MKADIAILGGGIIGSSIAWHLAASGQAGDVVVVEKDPTYEFAATPRGNGGIRQLFSLPTNIQMAHYGLDFYANFQERIATNGSEAQGIGFRRQGYLFLSDTGDHEQMIANHGTQVENGVRADLLDAKALQDRFPSLNVDDIAVAVHSADDAWIDPYAALMEFRKAATANGCKYVKGEITGWQRSENHATRLVLSSGESVEADTYVLACGAWSADIGAMIDLALPVEPMSRESYFFRCQDEVEPLPFLKSESDLAIRPEANGYVGGVPNWAEQAGWNFELSPEWFEQTVWPALAQRVPAMQTLKLERTWRGHYARNRFDRSPIIGRWQSGCENVVIATGFSGHGIMHAPATGRAVSELLTTGAYQSLDVSLFGYDRLQKEQPALEIGIV
ncbi:MAG: FAD-binding oxidoreductase [Pseudomonadota bacterium]